MAAGAREAAQTALRQRLEPLGLALQLAASLPSTNDELKAQALRGALAGPTLLLAEDQTAGRGTRGRGWEMQPGRDLALTLALPLEQVARAGDGLPEPRLPLVAAAAVAVALCQAVPQLPAVGLRWPNDLLLIPPVAKVCGLLLENSAGWLLCGVGLNVNSRSSERSPELLYSACSLRDATGRHFELCELAGAIAERLLLALGDGRGIEHWLREWSFRDVSSGGRYWLSRDGRRLAVSALGVDLDSGALRVQTDEREEFLVSSYQELERNAPQDVPAEAPPL